MSVRREAVLSDPAEHGASAAATEPSARRALAVMTFPGLLLTVLIFGYVVARGGAATESQLRAALPYLIAVNHTLVLGVLLVVLAREGRGLRDIGWILDRFAGRVALALAVGVAAGLGLYLFKELAFDSIRALLAGNRPTFTSLFRFRWDGSELPMMLVATTLVAVEESVYRGYGLAALARRWGVGWAAAAMAVLFGLLHWGNGLLAIVFTGTMGLAFAGLFLWRRSLLVPFVAHAVYNALVLLT